MRIMFEAIYDVCAKLYEKEEDRYKVAEKAATLIRDAYLKKPYALCGHSPKALIGAAIFISGFRLDLRKSQVLISKITNTAPLTIRANYILIARTIGGDLGDMVEKDIMWRAQRKRERDESTAKARKLFGKEWVIK